MNDAVVLPRAVVVAKRLQVLEVQAAVQRATLTATLAQWEQRGTLAWVATAAVTAAKMAGGLLATPTARWVLTALLLRLIRGRL